MDGVMLTIRHLNKPNHKSRAEPLCVAASIMNTANSRHGPALFAIASSRRVPETSIHAAITRADDPSVQQSFGFSMERHDRTSASREV
jgi:hypothetical protein